MTGSYSDTKPEWLTRYQHSLQTSLLMYNALSRPILVPKEPERLRAHVQSVPTCQFERLHLSRGIVL
jgi:hypothetical protein